MKILFLGTPRFAEIVFQQLIDEGFEIAGLVCRSDKVGARGNKVITPHIVEIAKQNNISVFQFEKLSEHIEDFKKIGYDIAVTASYGRMLPQSFLDIAPVVNVHPSLLPKYRGATPIQNALLNGDKTTGVTIMKTEIGMDDGDIYQQKEVEILEDEDYVSLLDKLAKIGAEMLVETLRDIKKGVATRTPQQHENATFVKPIQKEEGLLDFSKNVNSLVNKVRAYAESPVAYLFIGGERIKIYKAQVADVCSDASLGEIVPNKKRFLIQANGGVFEVLKCQAAGGKVLDAASFKNGYRFKAQVVDL